MTNIKAQINRTVKLVSSVLHGRALWCCLLALSLSAIMVAVNQQIKLVYVRDGAIVTMKHTVKDEPAEILDELGFKTMAYDVVDFSGFSGKIGVINIDRAFPVKLRVDGKTISEMTTDKTVGDLLKENNITLGEYDEISLPLGAYLAPNDEIVIKRIEVNTIVEHHAIPFETEYKENSLLRNGRTRTLVYGKDGECAVTYVDRVVDGVLQKRQQISSVVTKKPVTQLVLKGTNAPVSKLKFDVPLDANGVPVSYKKLLTNQVCTGYSSWKGAKGASRMVLEAGYVAVRADEIPYGTKMYITSPDNKFVYGYAIAADTGVGLMQNVIDIDLFYDTYIESCLNGRKYLNVYIL